MQIRLLILIAFLAFVIGVVFVTKSRKSSEVLEVTENNVDGGEVGKRLDQMMLREHDLPGEEPAVPPEFHVDVQIDTSGGKNKVIFTITEAHGYFAETFRIAWWKKGFERVKFDDFANVYLKANDTLVREIYAVPAELAQIDGDMGETGDWEAEVVEHGRVRLETPENWPPTDEGD